MRRRERPEERHGDVPAWVLRFRAGDMERYAGPVDGPDDAFVEWHGCQAGTGGSLADAWRFARWARARRAWRHASAEWWRTHAPTDPRAPWWVRREANDAG